MLTFVAFYTLLTISQSNIHKFYFDKLKASLLLTAILCRKNNDELVMSKPYVVYNRRRSRHKSENKLRHTNWPQVIFGRKKQ